MVNIKLNACVSPYPFHDVPLLRRFVPNMHVTALNSIKYKYCKEIDDYTLQRVVRCIKFC